MGNKWWLRLGFWLRLLNIVAFMLLLAKSIVLLYNQRVQLKSPEERAGMRDAGRMGAELLSYIDPHVREGVTTRHLDQLCRRYIEDVQHAVAAPLNYGGLLPGWLTNNAWGACYAAHAAFHSVGLSPLPLCGFPAATCISVNDVVCHGIPSDKVTLQAGDILNIDITVINAGGFHGDTSRMWVVGGREANSVGWQLVEDTHRALWLGIRTVAPGRTIGDVGHTISVFADGRNLGVVDTFFGHGIGRTFHEGPMVAHRAEAGTGVVLREGMIFTIEPMLNYRGKKELKIDPDQWTARTVDGALSAQWEHTILVTSDGYEVLTLRQAEETRGFERYGRPDSGAALEWLHSEQQQALAAGRSLP